VKKLLAIITLIILILAGTTVYQLVKKDKYNLVLVWANVIIDQGNKTIKLIEGKASVNDFINDVKKSEDKNILGKEYNTLLKNNEIPRYYMQVRYGSTYSKSKHIRVFSYFADAILFTDGALWRDA